MLERRPALGKGLSALIPDVPEPTRTGSLEVDLDLLSPNEQQPRLQPVRVPGRGPARVPLGGLEPAEPELRLGEGQPGGSVVPRLESPLQHARRLLHPAGVDQADAELAGQVGMRGQPPMRPHEQVQLLRPARSRGLAPELVAGILPQRLEGNRRRPDHREGDDQLPGPSPPEVRFQQDLVDRRTFLVQPER